jgi:type II secretory pathway pseudopilin PulG
MHDPHPQPNPRRTSLRPGFTLMELMVAIGLLMIIMLAIGVTFSGTSRSVGMSQATMEEMGAVRVTQRLLERDLKAIDRNGFLVITACMNLPSMGENSWRFDQLSFLVNDNVPNRSGAVNSVSPFTDSSIAGAGHVWWGQGVMEKDMRPDASYLAPGQNVATLRNQPPTGLIPGAGPNGTNLVKENEFTLLRHVTGLFPGPANGGIITPAGSQVVAYPGLERAMGSLGPQGDLAHITSSRFAAAAVTSAQVMQTIILERQGNANLVPEYEFYTYRFRALDSVYDTEVTTNPFVNGYFRTVPIVMRGVSSFRVEWTDGSVFPSNDLRAGQLKWYGPTLPSTFVEPINNTPLEPYYNSTPNANGDHYVAVFSYYNKAYWPKALRISMHVANDRLGGRDFVQVVDLPQ